MSNVFKFELMDTVRIKDMEINATVTAAMVDVAGAPTYRISFWYDGKRCTEWVLGFEIEKVI